MRSTPGVAFFGFEPVESHVMSCQARLPQRISVVSRHIPCRRLSRRPSLPSPARGGGKGGGNHDRGGPRSSPGGDKPGHDPGKVASASKPGNIRERKSPATHMHAAKFGAPGERRENLAGIEQALVVEGAFHSLLLVEIGL